MHNHKLHPIQYPEPSKSRFQHYKDVLDLSQTWFYYALFALALLLLSINLSTTPRPWIDEGYILSVAERFAMQGIYAPAAHSGVPEFNPTISTGPTVIVPIALLFKLAGAGFLQARLVMVVFALATLIAFALLAHRLVGQQASVLAATLLLAGTSEPFTSFILMSRHALGEVAALGFLLYAIWLWLHTQSQAEQRWWQHSCIGLALGLSIITKPQMVLAIPAGLGLLMLLDQYYYRQNSWRAYLITGLALVGSVAAWYLSQVAIAGPQIISANATDTNTGLLTQILHVDAVNIRRALGSLWRSGFLWLSLPGILYGLWQARRPDQHGLAHACLLVFLMAWTAWFVFMSVGWERYAFYSLCMSLIWTAQLIVLALRKLSWRLSFVLVAIVCGMTLHNFYTLSQTILGVQDTSTYRFASYMIEHVPEDATVISWEWELEILTPHQYHYPSTQSWYMVIQAVQSKQPIPTDLMDIRSVKPDYIIEGPYSSWIGIFSPYIREHGTKVVQIGPYALYRMSP